MTVLITINQPSLLNNKSLVTGANGFIGTQLLNQLLESDTPVRVLSRRPASNALVADTILGELGSQNISYAPLLDGIDTVFHLANTAHARASSERYQTDCETTIALARQAQQAGVQRFVFVSSAKAVDAVLADPYSHWKRVTEQRLLNEIDIPHIVIVRPCLVYGVGVKGNLDKLIRAVHRGYFPPLPDTKAERSMVSVNDVASAMIIAAANPDANRQLLVVSDGEPYTTYSIYCAIRLALGKNVPRWSVPLWLLNSAGSLGDIVQRIWPGCPLSTEAVLQLTEGAVYPVDKIRQLGWEPKTTFYKALPEIISACLDRKS